MNAADTDNERVLTGTGTAARPEPTQGPDAAGRAPETPAARRERRAEWGKTWGAVGAAIGREIRGKR